MNTKTFKKGESLFKEGEKAQSLFFIQTGKVSVFLSRSKQTIEIGQLGPNQVVGEQGLFGVTQNLTSAVAMAETTALVIPLELMKSQIDSGTPGQKLLVKSLGDKIKIMFSEIKAYRLEKDNRPCPEEFIPKVFGTLYHIANYTGKKNNNITTVDWRALKLYAQKVFLEPAERLEPALNILFKLKLCTLEMVKDEEDPQAPEILGYVHFSNLVAVEQFFEFYQHYFYKSGKAELLKTDETCILIVGCLLKLAEEEQPDRFGVLRLNYTKIMDYIKQQHGLTLNKTHLDFLEQKGLLVNMQSTDTEVRLSFYVSEFKTMHQNWLILREIEKWNQKGFVDLKEEEPLSKKKAEGACPSCNTEILQNFKFCSNCGFKLAA